MLGGGQADAGGRVSAAAAAAASASGLCVLDLFTGAVEGPVEGGVTRALDAHDVAALRVSAPPCASARRP